MISGHPAQPRIHLLGAHHHPLELMAQASVFVQPSLEEALGLALQEAIFQGCPAVGTRIGGIPEVIDEGRTGLLVAPASVKEMVTALASLMFDETMRAKMGGTGRDAIARKGMLKSAMIENHRALYLELLRPP
jgi:glycosyltransferase involved in cell wall biosynthesis